MNAVEAGFFEPHPDDAIVMQLKAERDQARSDADGYLTLIHAAVSHHLAVHPDCPDWRAEA